MRIRRGTGHGRPRSVPRVERSRPRIREILAEALAGLVQRPARTLLTMLGTVLGVGAFVAILGLTTTAGGQISQAFSVLSATQVDVQDVGGHGSEAGGADTQNAESMSSASSSSSSADGAGTRYDFPEDADARVERLNGTVHAGVWWRVPHPGGRAVTVTRQPPTSADLTGVGGPGIDVYAATPEALAAMGPTLGPGRLFDAFAESRGEHVVVLSDSAARRLGVSRLDAQPAVFLDGVPYSVLGIVTDLRRELDLLLGVIIPAATARRDFGPPTVDNPAHMIVETKLGAARLVASQAPLALSPTHPEYFQAVPPPDPHSLKDHVAGDLNALFLLLAAITLVIGAVGIANTTLVSVLERTAEIGLRRSLGARPRHIAGQFLTESVTVGALGGLIGTALGVLAVVTVAIAKHWTAVLNPAAVLPAPLIGVAVGLLAGAYPALRAARIEPVEALRR